MQASLERPPESGARRLRRKNLVLALLLFALILVFYGVSIVRMGAP